MSVRYTNRGMQGEKLDYRRKSWADEAKWGADDGSAPDPRRLMHFYNWILVFVFVWPVSTATPF
jgi:hypothetical protein